MASRFKRQRALRTQKPPPPVVADEDDYLSAAFITEQQKAPGMPNSDQSKRARHLADPDLGRVLSKKEIEKKMEDRREEGLQQEIGQENAGFKLLMKLGYKGGGLGKDGEGTTNPITVEMKQGRAGLGKESEARRRKEEARKLDKKRAARLAQEEVERRRNFRSSKAAQFEDRRLHQDLARAQRLVESLDEGDGRPRSVMWPEEKTLEETISELSGSNHIESWAADQGGGSTAALSTAAAASTTGTDGDDNSSTQLEKEGLGPDGGSTEEWESMTTQEKLSACLAYLRASHLYCMYCACKYSGHEDLQASCPGPSRDDHDDEEL